jgi:hypothetical protein
VVKLDGAPDDAESGDTLKKNLEAVSGVSAAPTAAPAPH